MVRRIEKSGSKLETNDWPIYQTSSKVKPMLVYFIFIYAQPDTDKENSLKLGSDRAKFPRLVGLMGGDVILCQTKGLIEAIEVSIGSHNLD